MLYRALESSFGLMLCLYASCLYPEAKPNVVQLLRVHCGLEQLITGSLSLVTQDSEQTFTQIFTPTFTQTKSRRKQSRGLVVMMCFFRHIGHIFEHLCQYRIVLGSYVNIEYRQEFWLEDFTDTRRRDRKLLLLLLTRQESRDPHSHLIICHKFVKKYLSRDPQH